MDEEEWSKGFVRCLGMLLNGQIMDEGDARGRHVRDDVLLLVLNAYHEPIQFTLPGSPADPCWELALDTARPAVGPEPANTQRFEAGQAYTIEGRALALLR